jgi:DNA-binding transcriptional regulator YiaG
MKKIVYEGLGFPVLLIGAHTEMIHGEELPIINHADLELRVFHALLWSTHKLTGAELSFVRGYMRKTQADLAKDIGLRSHSMISQWEAKGLASTGMDPATENGIRTLLANHIGLLQQYALRSLEILKGNFQELSPIEVNLEAA